MIGEIIMEARKAGRTPLPVYYLESALRQLRPRRWLNRRREKLLSEIGSRPDAGYIRDRADFYCRLAPGWRGSSKMKAMVRLGDLRRTHTPYYLDFQRILRWFPADAAAAFSTGNPDRNPAYPAMAHAVPARAGGALC